MIQEQTTEDKSRNGIQKAGESDDHGGDRSRGFAGRCLLMTGAQQAANPVANCERNALWWAISIIVRKQRDRIRKGRQE
jgi:hypothetical protein